jgi:site-specific recombinase XerD
LNEKRTLLKDRTREMIESDKDVQRWQDNLNSESAKRLYSESLCKFSEFCNLSSKQIVQRFKEDKKEMEDLLTDWVLGLKKLYTPKGVHNHLVGVKSWLRHNDIQVIRKINYGNVHETPTIENEMTPSQDELSRVLQYTDLRGRACIGLIAFAGLRPNASVNIKLIDIPELKIENGEVKLTRIPCMIKIKAKLSKNKRAYFTFLSSEGCQYLLEYLRYRIKKGENLTYASPVLTYSKKSKLHSFTRKGYSKLIKRTFIRANILEGTPLRPYILRGYFDTGMMNANINYNIQQFLMGHSGSIEAIYTTNKKLPEWQIEEMRKVFKEKVEPRLQTINTVARLEVDKLKEENERLKAELATLKAGQENIIGFIQESKPILTSMTKQAVIEALDHEKREQIIKELIEEAKRKLKQEI